MQRTLWIVPVWGVLLLLFSGSGYGWYLPGSAPKEYTRGDPVALRVDKVNSAKTQVPFSFYHFAYCQPPTIIDQPENLGEILKGDVIQNTAFELRMKQPEECKVLCIKQMSLTDLGTFISAIDDDYMINILADNLPAAMAVEVYDSVSVEDHVNGVPRADVGRRQNNLMPNPAVATMRMYSSGLPIGLVTNDNKHVLFNHWSFLIKYQNMGDEDQSARIVGFEATPLSLNHQIQQEARYPGGNNTGLVTEAPSRLTCDASEPLVLETLLQHAAKADGGRIPPIAFTYSIQFQSGTQDWGSRWNSYLFDAGGSTDIHWFSIVNSVMIVLLLSGIVAMILLRTLLRDIARYNQLDDLEDAQEETGWKLVHGDVFRRPNHSKLLAVCAGTGVQLLMMILLTLVLAAVGFLAPSNRGALVQAGLILFTLMGAPAGYVSARFNKLFDGEDTTRNLTVTCMTALQFPGVCFIIFFLLNLILWTKGSSGAVRFSAMFTLLLLWFGISLPLVFLGSYYGYKKPTISLPVRTNQIPRQIPPSHWILHPVISHALTGILPFCAVFTELLFVMSSVWQHRFYYLFGFLLLVLLILIITCAEISIAYTYFQLCAENYQWWWRSYWASAASAIYVFLYGIFYFHARLNITRISSIILYFGYTFLMAYSFFLFTGAVGFITTFFFVRAIYGAVKVD